MNSHLQPSDADVVDDTVEHMLELFRHGRIVDARQLALANREYEDGDALWEEFFGPWNPDDGEEHSTGVAQRTDALAAPAVAEDLTLRETLAVVAGLKFVGWVFKQVASSSLKKPLRNFAPAATRSCR